MIHFTIDGWQHYRATQVVTQIFILAMKGTKKKKLHNIFNLMNLQKHNEVA